MRDLYNAKLARLSDEIMEMGNLCGQAIMKTCQLLASVEIRETASKEIGKIEKEIDDKEHNIEALCMQLLLKQQPVGTDLRKISAALKMVTDMERIGDQAADIADLALHMDTAAVKVSADIAGIADATVHMVQGSIEAFVDMDLKKSRYVINSDDIVDNAFNEIKENLADQIYGKKLDARTGLDILMTAKYVERIGDHAVNIAEWVEYSITGQHRNNEHQDYLNN